MQIWIICLLTIFYIVSVDSMLCHSCESVYDNECGENFEPLHFFKLDCSRIAPPRYMDIFLENRNATGCLKMIYQVNNMSDTRIIRKCYFGQINDTAVGCRMDPTLTNISNQQCHVCGHEYCNAGNRMLKEKQIFIIFLAFLFTTFFISFN